jgi:hypothetical protein
MWVHPVAYGGAEMSKYLALAFAASLVSSSAFAQVVSFESANAAPKSTNAKDLDKIVCEVESTTGSRLDNHKVCKTVLEWQQFRRQNREGVEGFQRQGTSAGCQEGQSCVGGPG